MKAIMELEELKRLNIKSYIKVINYFRKEVGNSSSEEAIIKYTKQANYMFDKDGTIYRRVN